MGVHVILGERVSHFDPKSKEYVCVSGMRIGFDPETSREFWCTGYDLAFNKGILGNSILSEYGGSGSGAADKAGSGGGDGDKEDDADADHGVLDTTDFGIKVLPTMQLQKFPNIFAGGGLYLDR